MMPTRYDFVSITLNMGEVHLTTVMKTLKNHKEAVCF